MTRRDMAIGVLAAALSAGAGPVLADEEEALSGPGEEAETERDPADVSPEAEAHGNGSSSAFGDEPQGREAASDVEPEPAHPESDEVAGHEERAGSPAEDSTEAPEAERPDGSTADDAEALIREPTGSEITQALESLAGEIAAQRQLLQAAHTDLEHQLVEGYLHLLEQERRSLQV